MPPSLRILSVAVAGLVAAGQAGCVRMALARRIVAPPNHGRTAVAPAEKSLVEMSDRYYARAWSVPVGPPAAVISVGEIEPGSYDLKYTVRLESHPDGSGSLKFNMTAKFPTPGGPSAVPKGTLVLLHGIMERKESMLIWGLRLAQAGYRVVLVDLRGHGRSTGSHITFGAIETADLRQLTDDLGRRGLLAPPLGVLGESYGASIGLLWAASDPRVQAVVALEPYDDPRKAIVDFAHGFMPKVAATMGDGRLEAAVEAAPRYGGFRWEDVDVGAAVKRIPYPILFIHGAKDTWIPPQNSKELKQVAAPGSRRIVTPEDTHLSLPMRLDELGDDVVQWFQDHLAPAQHPDGLTGDSARPKMVIQGHADH